MKSTGEKFGEERFEAMMAETIRQKRKYNLKLSSPERAFIQKTSPGLVGEM